MVGILGFGRAKMQGAGVAAYCASIQELQVKYHYEEATFFSIMVSQPSAPSPDPYLKQLSSLLSPVRDFDFLPGTLDYSHCETYG